MESKTPELDKALKVREQSQAIGEFLSDRVVLSKKVFLDGQLARAAIIGYQADDRRA